MVLFVLVNTFESYILPHGPTNWLGGLNHQFYSSTPKFLLIWNFNSKGNKEPVTIVTSVVNIELNPGEHHQKANFL